MSYSISNVQSQWIEKSIKRGNGQVKIAATGIKITYDLRNADGSIDRITRVAENIRSVLPYYHDYGRCVTISEKMDHGEVPIEREDLKRYVPLQSKIPIRESDLKIMVRTQQQIINNYQQTINQLNAQIQNLLQNIQALKAANIDLKATQTSLKQQIDQLRAQVAAQNAEVATIPDLKAQIESQTNQIAMLTTLVQFIFQ